MAVKFPRLIANWDKQPRWFERFIDNVLTQIEKLFDELLAIPAIQEALAELDTAVADAQAAADAANTAADNAQSAADNAQTSTDEQNQESSLARSYVANYTPPLLQAIATGRVNIATHDRVYGDSTINPTVTINSGFVMTGGSAGDIVRIYYDDPSRAGGTVTFQFTIDPADPPVQSGNRHSVGAVEIPSVGTSDGKGVKPPGYVIL